MSPKLPFRTPYMRTTVIALALAGVAILVSKVRSEVSEAHTRFLFVQIRKVVSEQGTLPNQSGLLAMLRRSDIDWNSCGIADDRLLDGWHRTVSISATQTSLILRSTGRDGVAATADDITERIEAQ